MSTCSGWLPRDSLLFSGLPARAWTLHKIHPRSPRSTKKNQVLAGSSEEGVLMEQEGAPGVGVDHTVTLRTVNDIGALFCTIKARAWKRRAYFRRALLGRSASGLQDPDQQRHALGGQQLRLRCCHLTASSASPSSSIAALSRGVADSGLAEALGESGLPKRCRRKLRSRGYVHHLIVTRKTNICLDFFWHPKQVPFCRVVPPPPSPSQQLTLQTNCCHDRGITPG
jgi:hypothetical protein